MEMEKLSEKTIVVPEEAMGKVIGKGGARIASLAKSHSCDLKMVREEANCKGDTPLRIQSLRGFISDVLAAEKEVYDIVSKFCTRLLKKLNGKAKGEKSCTRKVHVI